ncbi:oligosaccharide flippase family protein [Candidatus Saccharibacteria bacterium]|nr:oligosaccharide flippase family protein [Candidatus Saccharibacteria bacterium]
MGKYKSLLKNISILTISNFGSKILAFLLLPLYTSVLSTEEYGDYDVIYTTITLLAPILTVNIAEGALRFLLEKESKKNQIIKITLLFNIFSVIVVAFMLAFNYFFRIIPIFYNYSLLFFFLYLSFSFYQTEQNITRGLDKIKQVGIGGLINSLLVLILNIVFLIYLKMGIEGFFIANILSYFVTAIYLFFAGGTFKHIERDTTIDKSARKDLVSYSRPMMLNSISWWINSASDRYLVTLLCGAAANGIYSMSYKIPTILTMFQSIFNQAWTISSVKTYDKDDKDNYFTNIYKVYNFLLTIVCSLIIIFSKPLASLLFKNEFFTAWEYMPFLLIAVVFSSLAGVLSGVFVSVKNSRLIGFTSLIGAIINVIFNIILINIIGPIGAAIATLISSFSIWAVRFKKAEKYIRLNSINLLRDCVSYVLLVVQGILLLCVSNWHVYLFEMAILFVIVSIYFGETTVLFRKALKRIRRKG